MSNISALIIGVSIIISGYYIGNGICKGLIFFKSNKSEYCLDDITSILFKIDDEVFNKKLVNKKYIVKKLGIRSKEIKYLIKEYPGLKSININGKVYYERKSVDNWIESIK